MSIDKFFNLYCWSWCQSCPHSIFRKMFLVEGCVIAPWSTRLLDIILVQSRWIHQRIRISVPPHSVSVPHSLRSRFDVVLLSLDEMVHSVALPALLCHKEPKSRGVAIPQKKFDIEWREPSFELEKKTISHRRRSIANGEIPR